MIGALVIALVIVIIVQMFLVNSIIPTQVGTINGDLRQLPKTPNGISSQTNNTKRYVEPIPFIGTFEESKIKLIDVMLGIGDMEIITDNDKYIHAVFSTQFMKFKDDVEFLFDTTLKKIHICSVSRVGRNDQGMNKERYLAIKKVYLD